MQLTNLFDENDGRRAVSPVIGVILMVAITVILAAVIGSFVLGLGQDVDSAPQASFNFDQEAGSGSADVTVQHRGGDSIDVENLEIRSEGTVKFGESGTTSFSSVGSTSVFAAGDSVKIIGVPSGNQIDVVYVSSSGDNVLASYTVQ